MMSRPEVGCQVGSVPLKLPVGDRISWGVLEGRSVHVTYW